MRRWIKSTILLCAYGFFIYIKPSEPFLTAYLRVSGYIVYIGACFSLSEEWLG